MGCRGEGGGAGVEGRPHVPVPGLLVDGAGIELGEVGHVVKRVLLVADQPHGLNRPAATDRHVATCATTRGRQRQAVVMVGQT